MDAELKNDSTFKIPLTRQQKAGQKIYGKR